MLIAGLVRRVFACFCASQLHGALEALVAKRIVNGCMNVAWGLLWRGSRSNVIAGLVRRVLRVFCASQLLGALEALVAKRIAMAA